jgi:hypothetical protein
MKIEKSKNHVTIMEVLTLFIIRTSTIEYRTAEHRISNMAMSP